MPLTAPHSPRWIGLKDAALYSRIGQKRLKELAKDGTIKGCKDPDNARGDWIFDRLSIDSYRENQCTETDRKCLAILKSLQ